MVKTVINQHRGAVRFESEPDEGTTFILSLPSD
jgi:signal transduction histidine kinase